VRKPLLFLAVVAAVLAFAGPAFAHEEITPKQFPTGQPSFFTFTAANEKKVDLTKLTLTSPKGVSFGATTQSPTSWTVNRTDSVITWTGGAVKPDTFAQWGFEIDSADQPGTLTYKATLGYSDGTSDDVNVQTTAVAGGTTATTVAGGTATTAATTESTTATTEAVKSGGASGARTRANIALVVGLVALVLGAIALAMAARKRGGDTAAPAAAGGGQKQDW